MNLLLLRGLAREQRHWNDFPQRLSASLGGCAVHALDLPGAGTEHHRDCPLSLSAMTDDVRARWLPLRDASPDPWAVVGISLGGMVTLQWLGDYPGDFSRAVVINTSAGDLALPWERMDLAVLPDLARAMVERDPVERERITLRMTTRVVRDHDSIARRWAEFRHDHPMRRRNVLRQIAAALRFRTPASVSVPLLVMIGARDPLANPICGKRIAARLGATLREHPAAGHDLPLDAPEWCAREITEFLAG